MLHVRLGLVLSGSPLSFMAMLSPVDDTSIGILLSFRVLFAI